MRPGTKSIDQILSPVHATTVNTGTLFDKPIIGRAPLEFSALWLGGVRAYKIAMRFALVLIALALLALPADAQVDDLGFESTMTSTAPASEPSSLLPGLPTMAGSSPDVSPATHPTTLPARLAATQPEAASAAAGQFPEVAGSYGLGEFFQHFAPYEPTYIVGGWQAPNVKFQFSIRYRLITPSGPLATEHPFLRGFNFAYSQTSLWDFSNPNAPFFYDSSYRPEFFYYLENIPGLKTPKNWELGAQGGVGHESNGQLDPNHRSLNIVYLQPIFTVGGPDSLFVTFAPKIYDYIGGLPLNPDMPKYRGYCDYRIVVGQRDGLQLAFIGRIGSDFNRGSAQFDLTYPLTKVLRGNCDLLLQCQYFYGYGDTLLEYNRRTSIVRFGLGLTR